MVRFVCREEGEFNEKYEEMVGCEQKKNGE